MGANETKNILLRSIVNNRNIPKVYRNLALYKLSLKNLPKKFRHVCLKNNKTSSVNHKFYLCKYRLKYLLTYNKAQNIVLNSW